MTRSARTAEVFVRAIIILAAVIGIGLDWLNNDPYIYAFFTIQSNTLLALFYVATFIWPTWSASHVGISLRGAVTTYILITGLVYHLVLVTPGTGFLPAEGQSMRDYVPNLMLHTVNPIMSLVSWFVLTRGARALRIRSAAYWMAFPLAYLTFTLVHGAYVNMYPYPFLDVDQLGYGGVALRCSILAVAFYGIGLGVLAGGRALDRRRTEPQRSLAQLPASEFNRSA